MYGLGFWSRMSPLRLARCVCRRTSNGPRFYSGARALVNMNVSAFKRANVAILPKSLSLRPRARMRRRRCPQRVATSVAALLRNIVPLTTPLRSSSASFAQGYGGPRKKPIHRRVPGIQGLRPRSGAGHPRRIACRLRRS
jgi:hypothetical protein